MRKDREILENAVRVVSKQATKAGDLVDEAVNAGIDGSHPLTGVETDPAEVGACLV